MKYTLLSFILLLISLGTYSQEDITTRSYTVSEKSSDIQIDGVLDEQTWVDAAVTDGFWLQDPIDGELAGAKSEVRMSYDDNYLYVAATLYDQNEYVITTLKRDRFGESDDFVVLIDPVGQKTNGFAFGVNAEGAQMEALVFQGDGDESWDNKWYSATQIYEDRWTVEMAIPYKTLRFNTGEDQWRINFTRFDPSANEIHVWNPVPRQFDEYDLGYYGELRWDRLPENQGANIGLIPYVSLRHDQEEDAADQTKVNIGGDAKIALSSSLNLDLTVNPDFSQVEVDDQVTNLTRFNIFFPEKRQFFIENGDVFAQFGQGADGPFYSRRIGLDRAGRTVPISYGARLTGNATKDLRIGVLNMHSKTTDQSVGQNYTALAAHQRIGQRSIIKGLLLNRQAYDGSESISGDYGRNIALQTLLSTNDGRWQAEAGYLQSYREGIDSDNRMLLGGVYYNGTRFRAYIEAKDLGRNYYTDMGFNSRVENFDPINREIVRLGFTQIGSMVNYYIYPDSDKVNFHWSGIENFVWANEGHGLTEWYTRVRHFIFFKNSSQVRFRLNNHYVDLIYPFALTETPLPAKSYNMTEFNVDLRGDQRKLFIPNLYVVYGEFYEGTKLTVLSSMSYRVQPWASFELGLEYNDINMPQPYGDLSITALTGRAEINFSTSLFWSTYLQYNTQAENFNVNSRLQWRFAPMSDLFFVYTDNYTVADYWGHKNRSVVLKFNYWLSI